MSLPLVSVLTPVFNGSNFLAECIESVLAQTYSAWEYIIVNNCSTDDTLDIAQGYQRKDKRIKVVTNAHFVGAIENHNIAFRCISPDSKYCKVVSSDDWIYPECVTKLVEVAEHNAGVGIVQGYIINKNGVGWPGLPHDITVFNGREICRLYLLGKIYFNAPPSSVLYRSSLVRSHQSFFPGSAPSADAAAYLRCLQESDLGFVHQILSFERIHDRSISAVKAREFDSYLLDRLELLLKYGPIYLSPEQMRTRLEERLHHYYGVLAVGVVNGRPREFWNYHQRRLDELGYSLFGPRLGKAVCLKVLDLLLNPKQTLEKVFRRLQTGQALGDSVLM